MRFYKTLFFLAALFFASCKSNQPGGVLPPEQMAAVLVDIHEVDGSLAEVAQHPDTLFKYSASRYQQLFKQHQTDTAQFKKSFNYYANKPDQLFDIYEKVVPVLKEKADAAAKVKAKADSLERIKQNKINEKLAKRAADSIARINKAKNDSSTKLKKVPARPGKLL